MQRHQPQVNCLHDKQERLDDRLLQHTAQQFEEVRPLETSTCRVYCDRPEPRQNVTVDVKKQCIGAPSESHDRRCQKPPPTGLIARMGRQRNSSQNFRQHSRNGGFSRMHRQETRLMRWQQTVTAMPPYVTVVHRGHACTAVNTHAV